MHRRASCLWGLMGLVAFGTATSVYAFDSDGDGVEDPFDVCCNTPPGILVDAEGRPIGDFDLDCDNDLADYAIYTQGFTGPLSDPVECACVSDIDCDDGNVCTVDICTSGACQYIPADAGETCDDTNLCTENDVCDGFGGCFGTPKDCSAFNTACTTSFCNFGNGACQVVPLPDGTACNDGNICTMGDQCMGGTCTSVPLDCDDGNDCTMDQCAAGACQHTVLLGSACDDGINCTTSDVCISGGICDGIPTDCSGLDTQCADGACSEATGLCDTVPKDDGLGCDDGDVNTVGDQCINGECVGTIP